MKKIFTTVLGIIAVLTAVAGALLLVAVYLDKLTALYERRGELKDKIPTAAELREKLPTRQDIMDKLPTKEELIRRNPFRKAEIEAEFSDYADAD